MSLQAAALYALVSVAGADKSIGDLRRVSGQVDATQGVLSGLTRNASQIGRGVGQVAGGMVRIGQYAAVALAGAGVAAAKTSIDFEDAFAQVEKTVEDTPAALAKIEEGLEQLSMQIPVTFRDLTTIASEAGALGVKTKDIEKFTEAVARTSAATVGLDPFMASEAFGKLSTIFTLTGDHIDQVTGKVESDYERLGSALVALGNAGASSEAEIIDISRYFAQAGQQAGISAAQVLAWGSALTSLGLEPEAGGGALQRLFQRITLYLGTGSKKAEEWARVSGQSVAQFKESFDKDASGAMIRFLAGLSELDQFAASSTLKKAGIINQRDIRAILALSQHIPVLTYQLGISTNAWDENTALMEVSEKRFDTLKAHIKEFTNTVAVGADAVGDGMTPAIGRLVEKAKEFLNLHMGDLENLGKDIGRAIDDIDWAKVNQGAQTAVDLGKTLLEIVSKIPPEITAGVAAFSVLNRLSGGLLGAGAGNIAGGVIGMAGTLARGALLSVLPPGLRGLATSATVMHVWVDNMPGGGLLGGPSVLPSAASLAGLLAPGLGTALIGLLTPFLMFNVIPKLVSNPGGDELKPGEKLGLTPTANQTMVSLGLGNLMYQSAQQQGLLPRTSGPIGDYGTPHPGSMNAGSKAPGPPLASWAASFQQRRDLDSAAILERALLKGFKPTPAAVDATLQRNILRQAQRQEDAANRTTDAVDRTTNAVQNADQPTSITVPIQITVPPVRAYQQIINETRHYGPSVPNAPRHSPGRPGAGS